MLQRLTIHNLLLIERVTLAFEPGLTVLTGETGAGKSILLDGLGLVLGERADSGLVRAGTAEARLGAEFALAAGHPALALVAEQGLGLDEPGRIVIRRTLRADGGSRAFINDSPVSAGLLRQLGQLLVEVHGQHADRGLLNPRGHLALVDSYAGTEALRAAMAHSFQHFSKASAAAASARSEASRAALDLEWLQHAAAELQALAPIAGEEEALAGRRLAMQKGARLAESLAEIDQLITSSNGALGQLRQAARRLERLRDEDPALAGALEAIDRALTEGDRIEQALADVGGRFRVSPEELEEAETRLFALRAAARKHQVAVEELPALTRQLAERLAAIEGGGDQLQRLDAAARQAEEEARRAAAALTKARRAAAARLDRAVAAELAPLKLEAARFRTVLTPAPLTEHGADQLQFEVATNESTGFGPLAHIASGGELSRFALALKVVLTGSGDAGTLVFDEIDRGVGGATASAIGSRLARVAESTQVLVVTHSPQVAAAGAHHIRIEKAAGRTVATPLAADERRGEIARMLSGAEITAEAHRQAERLLGAMAHSA